jgi:hypothetical protein
MTLKSQEHIELIAMFERIYKGRLDKEPKDLWPKGRIYQDGEMNNLFLAFRHGAAYGQAIERVAA